MDYGKRREELAQELQAALAVVHSQTQNALRLQGAIALLDEAIAEAAKPTEKAKGAKRDG